MKPGLTCSCSGWVRVQNGDEQPVIRLFEHRLAVVTGPPPDFARELKVLGFDNVVRGNLIEVNEDIHEPTRQGGKGVRILRNCTTQVAIVARLAEQNQPRGHVHSRLVLVLRLLGRNHPA